MEIKRESTKNESKVTNDVAVGKSVFSAENQIKYMIFVVDALRSVLEEGGHMDEKRWIRFMEFSEELQQVCKEADSISEMLVSKQNTGCFIL